VRRWKSTHTGAKLCREREKKAIRGGRVLGDRGGESILALLQKGKSPGQWVTGAIERHHGISIGGEIHGNHQVVNLSDLGGGKRGGRGDDASFLKSKQGKLV